MMMRLKRAFTAAELADLSYVAGRLNKAAIEQLFPELSTSEQGRIYYALGVLNQEIIKASEDAIHNSADADVGSDPPDVRTD
jgi:TRAP-type uncharacterized transport system substrate-binding protein